MLIDGGKIVGNSDGAIHLNTGTGNNSVKRVIVNGAGNVLIGGSLPSNPAITLANDGSALFSGSVSIGGTAALNTIDEYEEGTWIPEVKNANATYTTQVGYYVRIGKQVTVSVNLVWTNNDARSNFIITGLPFNTNSTYNAQTGSVKFISAISGAPVNLLYPTVETTSSNLYVRYIKTDGTSQNNWALAQNCNGTLRVNLTYIIP